VKEPAGRISEIEYRLNVSKGCSAADEGQTALLGIARVKAFWLYNRWKSSWCRLPKLTF
jgi:hypothetical protein